MQPFTQFACVNATTRAQTSGLEKRPKPLIWSGKFPSRGNFKTPIPPKSVTLSPYVIPMNRRDFTRSLAALAAVPALPLPAISAAPAAAATTAVAPPNLYAWSAMIARVHGVCSPSMLMTFLNIDAGQAHALTSKLMTNGVIGASNGIGVSQVTDSLAGQMPPRVGGDVVKGQVPKPKQIVKDVGQKPGPPEHQTFEHQDEEIPQADPNEPSCGAQQPAAGIVRDRAKDPELPPTFTKD